jgi:hypothetical protein
MNTTYRRKQWIHTYNTSLHVLWKPDWIHVHGNCAVVSLFWDHCMLWSPWLPGLSRDFELNLSSHHESFAGGMMCALGQLVLKMWRSRSCFVAFAIRICTRSATNGEIPSTPWFLGQFSDHWTQPKFCCMILISSKKSTDPSEAAAIHLWLHSDELSWCQFVMDGSIGMVGYGLMHGLAGMR